MEIAMLILSIVCILLGMCLARVMTEASNLRRQNLKLEAANIGLTVRCSQLEKEMDTLGEQLTHDSLTGVLTRANFTARLEQEIERARRSGEPLSLAFVDVDHFKKVNDTYGHLAGDAVLQTVGGLLNQLTRETDDVGRWGGEEFVILMSGASANDAGVVAERVRLGISRVAVENVGRVTVSVGVQTLVPKVCMHADFFELFRLEGEDARELNKADMKSRFDWLIANADACMYRAKRGGRNKVVISTDVYEGDDLSGLLESGVVTA